MRKARVTLRCAHGSDRDYGSDSANQARPQIDWNSICDPQSQDPNPIRVHNTKWHGLKTIPEQVNTYSDKYLIAVLTWHKDFTRL